MARSIQVYDGAGESIRPRKPKQRYVVRWKKYPNVGRGGYVIRSSTRSGLVCGRYEQAKRFETEEAALTFAAEHHYMHDRSYFTTEVG